MEPYVKKEDERESEMLEKFSAADAFLRTLNGHLAVFAGHYATGLARAIFQNVSADSFFSVFSHLLFFAPRRLGYF